jgi:hypothetical protein
VFCIPTRWRAKHPVDQSRLCYDIVRYTHLYSLIVESGSSLLRMLQSAIVSIAFLAILGQGQISKPHIKKSTTFWSVSSPYHSLTREPLHIFPPTPKRIHSTPSRSSKRCPPASLIHLRFHSHYRDNRLHQPDLPDPSPSPSMFRRHVPGSQRQSLHR